MKFTAYHLLQLAAFLLPLCELAHGRRSHSYHESWTQSNKKSFKDIIRGTPPDNLHRTSSARSPSQIIRDKIVPSIVPIDQFRKPFDQFKWPWKNYEEWKRHQKKIEDRIDRMLKPRNRRFPPERVTKQASTKLPKNRKQGKNKIPKPDKNPLRKNRKKKKAVRDKKLPKIDHGVPLLLKLTTTTETATRSSSPSLFPYHAFPTGGEVLYVKYYSTNDP